MNGETTDQPISQASQTLFPNQIGLESTIEALLFASPEPLTVRELIYQLDLEGNGTIPAEQVQAHCNSLKSFYQQRGGGFELVEFGDKGYHFRTVAEASPWIEYMFSKRPRPLSRAANETLAIIAYRQPVSRADVEFIRGVDAGSIIKNLLDRNLIECIGRRDTSPGKPMLFATTSYFLQVFRINSLEELPPIESFQPAQKTVQQAFSKLSPELEQSIPYPDLEESESQ
ncbi:MAG: SMC-Scp complex subunit ScpB [Zetaproteobacteria bacterium]|nr:SMC-Scp complex subunit ScpB [Zetaproteobacteria bacterium]